MAGFDPADDTSRHRVLARRAYPAGHVIGVTVMTGPVPMPGGVPRSAKSRLHN
jgi:hypothetical protein